MTLLYKFNKQDSLQELKPNQQSSLCLKALLSGLTFLTPPFVLVGHSLGGLIARMYNREYPNEVEGMVLVDPTSEDGTLFINGKIQKSKTPGFW